MHVVVICDAYIILDGILGTQIRIVLLFPVTEGTEVVVNLIDNDVWEAEDERKGALNEEVQIWDLQCL